MLKSVVNLILARRPISEGGQICPNKEKNTKPQAYKLQLVTIFSRLTEKWAWLELAILVEQGRKIDFEF